MPRKKSEPSTVETTSEESAQAETTTAPTEKPKRTARARTKAAVPAPEVAQPGAVPEPEAKPKSRSRGRVKQSEPEAAPAPAPAPVAAEEPKPARTRSRSRKQAEPDDPIVEAQPKEIVPEAKKPSRSRSRKPQKEAAPAPAPEPEASQEEAEWEDDLPVPIWRPRTQPAPALHATELSEATRAGDEEEEADKRKRRRRRRGRKGGTTEDEAAEVQQSVELGPEPEPEPVPEPEPKPRRESSRRSERKTPVLDLAPPPVPPAAKPVVQAPLRPLVEIPQDAPQVVLRDGVPTLVRAGKVYPPILFFGSPSDERRAKTVLEELRMAAESGVHLHSFLLNFEVDKGSVDSAVSLAAYLLAQAVKVDPQAQVIYRIALQAPRNWEDRYPNARYRDASGEMAEPSVCDDQFWGVAEDCLAIFVKQLRLLEMKDHILGLHLERGEWFLSHEAGYDTSAAAKIKFRDWARTRYLNDEVTLRASWFDGDVRFENIVIPEFLPEGSEGERFVRSSRKQRRYVDYHLFLSDATVARISDLAYAVKKASDGYFLIGTSYGYTFEWSHPSSGHLSLGKLLRAPDIDFVAGPPSYRSREPGGTSAFPCPIDSFALNGKLYISEEDFKTSLSQGHEPDDFNPPLKTPQALESVHWRGVGSAMAHASGVAWMDLWGNGWLTSYSTWERASRVLEALTVRMGVPTDNPEVAVFIDERALGYLVDENAFTLLVQNAREAVLRAGLNAAFYLLSDLQHRETFPESKLYLFLNAWDIRPELRAAIKTRLQRDNKVLFWLYSAGLFDAGRDSLERAREVTGIALKPQPFYSKSGTTILNRRHPLAEAFPDRSLVGGSKLEPSYFAIPEEATVLGEYTQTGLPSFVVKDFREGDVSQHWTSVFLGEPLVNPALVRALATMAGAHVWNFQNDVTHIRPPFLTVHCTGTGPRTITMPDKSSAFNLHSREWAAVDSTHLRFNAMDGSTHTFLVGPKEEIEQILNQDPTSLLRMDVLPPRQSNVLHGDISNFDVPVMKLDEWIETSDNDEVADDWFLRAPQVVEEQEQATMDEDRPGRRRRRRRGGRGNGRGSEEVVDARKEPSGTPQESFDNFEMNVVFRRRD